MRLRHRVGFYQRGEADAAARARGVVQGSLKSVPEFPPVAAEIRPRLGGETAQAARLAGTNLVTITVRQCNWTRQVTTDWTVRDERSSETYNIRSIVDPDKRGRWLEMLCEFGVAV